MKTKTKRTNKPSDAAGAAEAARKRVTDICARELELSRLQLLKVSELAAIRAKRGDAVLASTDPGAAARDSARQVAALEEEASGLADAAAAARRQRLEAIPRVWLAQADELEAQAADLESQATDLEARSNELRRALEQFDGWLYLPATALFEGRPIMDVVPRPGQEFRFLDGRGPRFKGLRTDAAVLRERAVQLRFHTVPEMAGSVEAGNLEQLIEAAYLDPMRVAPVVEDLASWFEQAVGRERSRRARIPIGDDHVPVEAPIAQIHLEWRQGKVDAAASWIRSAGQIHRDINLIDMNPTIVDVDPDAGVEQATA